MTREKGNRRAPRAAPQASRTPEARRALLVGINYAGSSCPLQGCINDVKNVRRMLVSQYGYAETDIVELLEKQATRAAILREYKALLHSGADRLFFLYSGHGGYELCRSERAKTLRAKARELGLTREPGVARDPRVAREAGELDGRDETLIPYDYRSKGEIVDNELRELLCAAQLKAHVQLVAVFDCCHSGSGLDLAYTLDKSGRSLQKGRAYPPTEAKVILLSGCEDEQTSADALEEGERQGAMCFSLQLALARPLAQPLAEAEAGAKPRAALSWREMYAHVQCILKEREYDQVPRLTCGRWFDLDEELSL